MGEFKPFREPASEGGEQLVRAEGPNLVCNGCSGVVPDGSWLFESIKDGMVVGLIARAGGEDAPVVHECGEN